MEATLAQLDWDADRTERVREYLRHRTEEQYGVWIGDLDAHGLDDDAVDGDEVVFPDGYDQLADHLAVGLEVRLEHVVRAVRWSEQGVTITTDRGDVTADRAVVTVPIGVLKSDDFEIEPALPEPVAGAVDRLEMNAFEKVFLRFPRRFWDDGVYAIRQQGPHGVWWHSWYDLSACTGSRRCSPSRPDRAPQRPAAGTTTGWSPPCSPSSGGSTATASRSPCRVHVTRWQDDPYARGSYAYMTVGSTPDDHDLLATPGGWRPAPRRRGHLDRGSSDRHGRAHVRSPRRLRRPRPRDLDRGPVERPYR